MNPIEIGKAINDYGIAMVLAIVLILVVWLVRYLVKQQTDDRVYYRELVTNDMKGLHKDNVKNADLNNQTIVLQKDMMKQLEEHNGFTKKLGEKTIKALEIVCDRLNGGAK